MKNKPLSLILLGSAAVTLLGACTPVIAQRGNMLEEYQIAKLTPGESSRSDVLRTIGSPTTTAPFDDTTWYYIGQETEKRGILDPEVVEERIFVVTFNEDGIMQSLQQQDQGRLDVPITSDKTPTHGNEITVMQQFLGNLGKFNPAEQD